MTRKLVNSTSGGRPALITIKIPANTLDPKEYVIEAGAIMASYVSQPNDRPLLIPIVGLAPSTAVAI